MGYVLIQAVRVWPFCSKSQGDQAMFFRRRDVLSNDNWSSSCVNDNYSSQRPPDSINRSQLAQRHGEPTLLYLLVSMPGFLFPLTG